MELSKKDELKVLYKDYVAVSIAFGDVLTRYAEKSLENIMNDIYLDMEIHLTPDEQDEYNRYCVTNESDLIDWLEKEHKFNED